MYCPVGSLVLKMPFVSGNLLNFLSQAVQNKFTGLKVEVDILSGLWSLAEGLQRPPNTAPESRCKSLYQRARCVGVRVSTVSEALCWLMLARQFECPAFEP